MDENCVRAELLDFAQIIQWKTINLKGKDNFQVLLRLHLIMIETFAI